MEGVGGGVRRSGAIEAQGVERDGVGGDHLGGGLAADERCDEEKSVQQVVM